MKTNRLILIGTHISALLIGASIAYNFPPTAPSSDKGSSDDISTKNAIEGRSKKDAGNSRTPEKRLLTDIVVPVSYPHIASPYRALEEQRLDANSQKPFSAASFASKTQQMLLDLASSDPYGSLAWLFSDSQDALRFKLAYPLERIATVRQIVSAAPKNQLPGIIDILRNNHEDGLLISALCAAASGDQPKLNRLSILDNIDKYATNDAMGEQLKNVLLTEWAAADIQSAQTWALKQKDPSLRDNAIIAVAGQMVNSDPISAIQLVKNNLSDSLSSGEFEYLVSSWIDQDPQSVLAWLEEQPPSQDIDNALRLLEVKTTALDQYNTASHTE